MFDILSVFKRRPKVSMLPQKIEFVKYPYAVATQEGEVVSLFSNMAYMLLPVINNDGKSHIVGLKAFWDVSGQSYSGQVLSSDSSETPNPKYIEMDGGETKFFHPIAVLLKEKNGFLPIQCVGVGGAIRGPRIPNDVYKLHVSLSVDGKDMPKQFVMEINVPETVLEKATIPNELIAYVSSQNLKVVFNE